MHLAVKQENDEANIWLDNQDLRPTPAEQRTWGFWTYSFFWLSAAATISNWYSPTAFMSEGLTIWEAAVVHLAGQFLAGIMMVFTGRPGAKYHIGFPVQARASFGLAGAVWPVLNRAAMSIVWNGINIVQAGQCIYVMLRVLFPSITDLPNVMQQGDALNSGGLIGFFMAWMIVLACCFISIPMLKYYSLIKLVVFFISAISLLSWTISTSGLGRVTHTPVQHKSWVITKFVFLSWANCSTFIVNAADLQRYAKRPNNVILGQVVGFPLGNFIIAVVGILVAQTSGARFGEIIWNPIIYLDRILDEYTAANRAACFMLALLFAYSCIFSCIYENILPAGNDIAALCPKYLNVRRGCLLCTVLSLACVPWKLIGTATSFISWLSAYQIFLSTIIGVMVAHYLLNRGVLNIDDLYRTGDKQARSQYYYTRGVNLDAYLSYLLGIAPNFYGFLGNVGMNISRAGQRAYYFAFPIGFLVSAASFWLLNPKPRPTKS